MKSRAILVCLPVLFLTQLLFLACGLASDAPSINRELVYKNSYDEVWHAVTETLAARGKIIRLIKKDSGIIGFEEDLEQSQFRKYADTNIFWRITHWVKFRAKVNFLIQKISPSETRILINAQFRGWSPQNFHLPDHFKSNGKLEEQYLNEIRFTLP